MWVAALELVGATPPIPATPLQAERAFARDAQRQGQWRSFETWSTDAAIMFLPQPGTAHAFLKGRPNPPSAVQWPARSDGKTGITEGRWASEGGRAAGWFTTVWRRTADGWRWVLDHGDQTPAAAGVGDLPSVLDGWCHGRPTGAQPLRLAGCQAGKEDSGSATIRRCNGAGPSRPMARTSSARRDGTASASTPCLSRQWRAND